MITWLYARGIPLPLDVLYAIRMEITLHAGKNLRHHPNYSLIYEVDA
jgi:hypothetical protein